MTEMIKAIGTLLADIAALIGSVTKVVEYFDKKKNDPQDPRKE